MSEAIRPLSFDEFLAGELDGPQRHEFVGGRVYVMSGGTERHDVMVRRSHPTGARGEGCRTFASNRLLRTPDESAYYPDFMVTCGDAADVHYENDAAMIAEVLSPSTADTDRREKSVAYVRLRSPRLLLLVDPTQRRIEVARPLEGRIAGWDVHGPGDIVQTPCGDLDVDSLYTQVDDEATTEP